MKPTAMLYRNLMAMDVEESIRSYPFDAVVLIGGCDKSVPAQLMGASSVDVPAIMITGGPAEPAFFRGKELGVGTDLWRFIDDFRAGRMSKSDLAELETALMPSAGHCNEMGTASTMAGLVEGLGMSLPGSATVPAVASARSIYAEETGIRAVGLAREGLRPSAILTEAAFDNAITLLMALGGSTNAVIHLLAIAGRVGVDIRLDRFDEIARRTPVIVDVRPGGAGLVEDLHYAGGIPAVLAELNPLLHGGNLTVTGGPLEAGMLSRNGANNEVIRSVSEPLHPSGSIAVLRGNLAPRGAVIKVSAASPGLLLHKGPAVVFEDMDDLQQRIDDPGLDVTPDSVLVLKNAGPCGGPGMPEWGALPIPAKLVRKGVRDVVRISDARMSGTAFGTCVLHVAPEAAAGGPLASVRTGDLIALDVEARRLNLEIPNAEMVRRLQSLETAAPRYRRGYGSLYLQHVLQADEGCDFDFLRSRPDDPTDDIPLGLLEGWIGGW